MAVEFFLTEFHLVSDESLKEKMKANKGKDYIKFLV